MLYENGLLRAIILPIMKAVSRDITIRHHWTGQQLKVNLFAHKGYWYHGRRREKDEMRAIELLVEPGDLAVEVGGHIGYIALLLARAVGYGKLIVFEPGSNNLPYLRANLADLDNVTLIEKGCGPRSENMTFFEESLTGQNNSFVSSFRGLQDNAANAPNVSVDVTSHVVPVVRLDQEVPDTPAFVKIDVEGFELAVLHGAESWFENGRMSPIFMIEVQADHAAIADWFSARGYKLFDVHGRPMMEIPETTINLFALAPRIHAARLERWQSGV
jgi:FkbM family methyltransferase